MRRVPAARVQSVALPRDAAGCVRRECPHCGRALRTRPHPRDGEALLRALDAHFALEHADGATDADAEPPCATCAYCGKRAPLDEWHTEAQRGYLEALAHGLAEHVRYEQLAHVERTLALNPGPTFVAVAPPPLPADFAPEPDADDARPRPTPCCGEELWLESGWGNTWYCFRCGARHEAGPTPTPQRQLVQEPVEA